MKSMRKLLVPIFILVVAGCDSERRDFAYCDSSHGCKDGYTCDKSAGICKPDDAAVADALRPVDAGTSEAASDAVDASVDAAKDAPESDVADANVVDQAIADTRVVDVQAIEVTPPDTRTPDAAGSCGRDEDCTGAAGGPFCVGAKCVACKTAANCNNDAGVPFCSAQNTCVSCASAGGVDGGAGCSGATPVCDRNGGSCVECTQNGDCKTSGKGFCSQHKCVGCDGVTAGSGCSGSTPACVPSNSGTAKAGQCVGCLADKDCSGDTPICNSSNVCERCTADSQCTSGPGICMFHQGGRCATEAETIYVAPKIGCSSGSGSGTKDSPFCNSQNAIVGINTNKRVIKMSGGALWPISSTTITSNGQQISIVGETGNATITPGAALGIHVTGGNVYVRGITIEGSTSSAGIIVDAGATLGLDRCVVKNNLGGGLIVNSGANFDVANSIFDGNGPGQVGTTTTFGGVYLGGSPPASGPSRFWFNTVVNNLDKGVICYDTTQALSGMLLKGNNNGDYLSCALDKTSVWVQGKTAADGTASYTGGDLSLDPNDRLTSTNYCKDHVDSSTLHPSDDIDGDVRPKGAKLDCGADEY
jgi:hypothetical protein